MKMIALFLSSLVFSSISYAGPVNVDTDGIEVGNGGFIVYCPVNEGEHNFLLSAEFFDYFEYKKENPEWVFPSAFIDKEYYKTALKILQNYEHVDKFSASSLITNSMMWFALEQTQTALSLVLTDTFYKMQALVPAPAPYMNSEMLKDCESMQIISFSKNESGSYEYRILAGHFAALDTVNKAIALIHEINYLDQIQSADNSPLYPNVIRQTQFIFSLPDLQTASPETILEWQTKNSRARQLNRLEFSQYGKFQVRLRKPAAEMPTLIQSNSDYINAYWNPIYRLETYPNGKRILSAFLENSFFKDEPTEVTIGVGGRTYFYENGEIKEAELRSPLYFNKTFCFSKAYFNKNGHLDSCK